jgi:hypothetical protein
MFICYLGPSPQTLKSVKKCITLTLSSVLSTFFEHLFECSNIA